MNILNDLTSKEKLIYLAGLMEGEGCFTTHHGNRVSPHGGIMMKVRLGMTDLDTMQWVKDNFGGGKLGAYNTKGSDKLFYRLNWGGKNAKDLALLLYPYMSNRRRARIEELTGLDK